MPALFGPVFWYDLVRTGRQRGLISGRVVFGVVVLAVLLLAVQGASPHRDLFLGLYGGYTLSPANAARMANGFFGVFVALQFAAILLMLPASAATAIGEERARNTLLFLLTSRLTAREVVLGKFTTRLMVMGQYLLTGLPVIGLLQLMGGVDQQLVIAAYLALAATMVSCGGLGTFWGVFARKPEQAAWRAYQCLILLAIVSALSIWAMDLLNLRRQMAFMRTGGTANPAVIGGRQVLVPGNVWRFIPAMTFDQQLLDFLNQSNPFYAIMALVTEIEAGEELDIALWPLAATYCGLHLAFGLALTGTAWARLRAVAAAQTGGLVPKKARSQRPAAHPKIGDRPVLWKELYIESRPRQRWLAMLFGRWGYVASFLPAWILIFTLIDGNFGRLRDNTWALLRYGGTLMIAALIVRTAVQAARSVNRERERDTLDGLLASELPREDILRDKWWGAFASGRWMLLWLGIHWLMGWLITALHPLAIPIQLAQIAVYTATAASLGMLLTVTVKSSRAATVLVLLVMLIAAIVLPVTFGSAFRYELDTIWAGLRQNTGDVVFGRPIGGAYRFMRTFSPIWLMSDTVIPEEDYFSTPAPLRHLGGVVADSVVGLALYGLAAFVLFNTAVKRFRNPSG